MVGRGPPLVGVVNWEEGVSIGQASTACQRQKDTQADRNINWAQNFDNDTQPTAILLLFLFFF